MILCQMTFWRPFILENLARYSMLLWWHFESRSLNPEAFQLIQNTDNDVYLSAASSWEIVIKYQLGKLPLPEPPHSFISAQLISNHIVSLPIENRHVFRVGEIPLHNRDPFDRMLIAQAQVESMALLTADSVILKYEVKSIWASRLKPSHLTRRQPLRKK